MTKYAAVTHKNFTPIRIGLIILALFFGTTAALQPQTVQAHGGVVVDGGFTPEYEWLVLSANSPLVEGKNLMSFVIYDVDTYAPINGMRVEVLVSHESDEVDCCNAEDHIGPIELEADPENWPGDYSYELPLDGFGNFALKFIAYKGDSTEPAIEAISRVLVLPDLSQITPQPNPNITPSDALPVDETPADETPADETPTDETPVDAEPTDTKIMMPVASSETPSSAPAQNANDLSATTGAVSRTTAATSQGQGADILSKLRSQWMLWTAAGVTPLALLAFLLFRPSMDELVAQKETELLNELDEDELDD